LLAVAEALVAPEISRHQLLRIGRVMAAQEPAQPLQVLEFFTQVAAVGVF
jgi:hypothetical protein